VIQIAGLVVIGVAIGTWVETGRETSLFVGAGLIMIGVGAPIASLFTIGSSERNERKKEDSLYQRAS
jgi:hypothetical protein